MRTKKECKTRKRLGLRRHSTRSLDNCQEEFDHQQRANWCELVPEIAFVMLKCRAACRRVHIREIADEAIATYLRGFDTYFDGRKVPDYSLILLTLDQAKKREWGFIAGNWFKGWKLTKKGTAFARDVQRRRDIQTQQRRAA